MSILDINFNRLDDGAKQLLKAELFRGTHNYLNVVIKPDQLTEEKPIYSTFVTDMSVFHGSSFVIINGIDQNAVISIRSVSREQARREFGNPHIYHGNDKYEVFRIIVCDYSKDYCKFTYLDIMPVDNHKAGIIKGIKIFYINVVDSSDTLKL